MKNLTLTKLNSYLHQRAPPIDILDADLSSLFDEQERIAQVLVQISTHNANYVRVFLKQLIGALEKHTEVCDELYELLCSPEIMGAKELDPQQKDEVKYFVGGFDNHSDDEKCYVTIRESPRLISGANTTGLRTWEAALFLANYLVTCNLENASVCELGAGTGLVSAALVRQERIKRIVVTDGASGLMEGLGEVLSKHSEQRESCLECENVKHSEQSESCLCENNKTKHSEQSESCLESEIDRHSSLCSSYLESKTDKHNSLCSSCSCENKTKHSSRCSSCLESEIDKHSSLCSSRFSIQQLLWGSTNKDSPEFVAPPPNVDYIVAADVTYDESVVGLLASTISDFFAGGTKGALIAATVRNERTIGAWEAELDKRFTWRVRDRCLEPEKIDACCCFRKGTPEIRVYEITKGKWIEKIERKRK